MNRLRLVADVGGTNARFALSPEPGDIGQPVRYATSRFESFDSALSAFLEDAGHPSVGEARIAAAGPVEGDTVSLTNLPWRIDAQAVSARIGGGGVHLFNDLEAVAMLLPHLGRSGSDALGTSEGMAGNATRIAINAGTGFGAATARAARPGEVHVQASEAGHMSFAARHDDEIPLLRHAATVEDFLSGSGIARLHDAVRATLPRPARELDAASVFRHAGDDEAARLTVRHFSRILGRVAGDLVLATGAWGGVYFCGSVMHAWRGVADLDAFETAFRDKGAMSARMAHVPVRLITEEEPALLGLSW